MASLISGGTGTFTTNNGSKSFSFTPAVGDQIVVVAAHSGNSSVTAPTDDQSGTYTSVISCVKNSSADWMGVWVRDQLVTLAVAHNITSNPGTTSGGGLFAFKGRGFTGVGSACVVQSSKEDNGAAAGTATTTMGAACQNHRPVLVANFNATTNNGVTVPTGFPASLVNTDYSTPTTAIKVAVRYAGETRSVIPWGSASATAYGALAVEFETVNSLGGMLQMFQDF